MTAAETLVARPSLTEAGPPSRPLADHHDDQEMRVSRPPYAMGPTEPDHPDGGREVRPVGRYEWEQIVRRARLTGVVAGSGRVGRDGRATRGGLAAATVKAVALALATYADHEGRNVRPGDATLAVDLECGLKTIRTVKSLLLDLGLLTLVRSASRGRAEEYRLTLPVDLLELLDVLTPAQHQLAARQVREAARGKRGAPRSAEQPDPMGWSAGHPQEAQWGGPPDTPNEPPSDRMGWSAGPTQEAMGWSAGPTWGGPPDPRTDKDRASRTTNDHSGEDLRTAVTVPRARRAVQDQFSRVESRCRPPGGRPPDNRPHGRAARPDPPARPGIHPDTRDPDQLRATTAAGAARARQALAQARPARRPATRVPGEAWAALIAATAPIPTASETGGTP